MINCDKLRIVFAGTPEFAVPALQMLAASPHEVIAVFTQPDRPSGRGRKVQESAVKLCATGLGIPVFQPVTFREPSARDSLAELRPDIMVVVAYGLLLPADVLGLPVLGCINIHGSLLPRWRGAAPVQRAIMAGDSQTGVTIMQMNEGLDTGPMLAVESVAIEPVTTAATLQTQLSRVGADLLGKVLPGWCNGNVDAQPQDDALATYATKLAKSEAKIDWTQPALEIHRKICAFNPAPVAETTLGDARVRLWRSSHRPGDFPDVQPGTVIRCDKAGFEVAAGQDVLTVLELQLPGKKAVNYKDFVNGRDITGTVLGGGTAQGQVS